jgi:hypothetical protein
VTRWFVVWAALVACSSDPKPKQWTVDEPAKPVDPPPPPIVKPAAVRHASHEHEHGPHPHERSDHHHHLHPHPHLAGANGHHHPY